MRCEPARFKLRAHLASFPFRPMGAEVPFPRLSASKSRCKHHFEAWPQEHCCPMQILDWCRLST